MLFISVIIPTFNRAPLLLRAITSVLNQGYKNFEIIVVDDGSIDETETLLSPMIKLGNIKYFKQENLGVSAARNFGSSQALGDWIAFLDSDDEWLPSKLELQIAFLQVNPNVSIVYGAEVWMRNGVRVNQSLVHQKFGGWIFDKCVQQCFIAPSSLLIKKSLLLSLEGFDPDFKVCEDYDLWLKMSSLYEVGFISEPLMIKYGGHTDQLSTQFVAMDFWRIKSLNRILKIRKLSDDQKILVIETMRKKGTILIKGFQKHGNFKAAEEVETILKLLQ